MPAQTGQPPHPQKKKKNPAVALAASQVALWAVQGCSESAAALVSWLGPREGFREEPHLSAVSQEAPRPSQALPLPQGGDQTVKLK